MATKTNNYVSQAEEQLKGQLESNKNNLQNNFNTNMNDLESQKGEIDKQYTGLVEDTKKAGETNKANYNNATLNRGLARSTIATTGIAGIQNTTDTNVVSINTERQSQMNNIAKLKDMLRNNLTNSLSSLESEYNSNVNSLAMQLQQRAEDVAYRNKQLSQSQALANSELAYKYNALKQNQSQYDSDLTYKYDSLKQNDKQFGLEMDYKYASLEDSKSNSINTSSKLPTYSNLKTQITTMDSSTAAKVLSANRAELLKQYGVSQYNGLVNAVKEKDPIGFYKSSSAFDKSQVSKYKK